jgi:predicted methyltransferase MtxX (methanogen marker protein 4)
MLISDFIYQYSRMQRATVAIGISEITNSILDSLKKAAQFSDIIIVGKKIDGFESISESRNFGETLVNLLKQKKVDAIVRGNLPASETMLSLANQLGYDKILRTACLKDLKGREFLLTPAAQEEGNSIYERIWMIQESSKFLNKLEIIPQVGVLSLDVKRGKNSIFDQSIDEAEIIVSELSKRGIYAECVGHAIEMCVGKFNIVVPQNGVVGNYIWRSIVGFGGGLDLGDFGLIDEVFVDDSRYWDSFYQPIMFAVALTNIKKGLK